MAFQFTWLGFGFNLGKDFAFEMCALRKIMQWNEPKVSIEMNWYLHSEMDHCPRFEFGIIFLWWMLLEITLLSVHHVEMEDSKVKVLKLPCPECGKEAEFRFEI